MGYKLKAIYCTDTDGLIGVDNKLPWDIPEDIAYFKQMTMGSMVLMGRRTLESIPVKLVGRHSIVVSTCKDYSHPNADIVLSSLKLLPDIVSMAASNGFKCTGEPTVWVIGGKSIIESLALVCEEIHVTRVYASAPIDGQNQICLDEKFLKYFVVDHNPYIHTSKGTGNSIYGRYVYRHVLSNKSE